MVIHQYRITKGMFGGTHTGTLCGRMNKASQDGMNSGDADEVTCKFCLRQREAIRLRNEREKASCEALDNRKESL